MNDEPQLDEINEEDRTPATRGDLSALEGRLANQFTAILDDRMKDISDTMKDMRAFIEQENNKTRDHFDLAVENIEDEMKLANREEIGLITNQQLPNHEERIQELEKKADLPIGPRHAPVV